MEFVLKSLEGLVYSEAIKWTFSYDWRVWVTAATNSRGAQKGKRKQKQNIWIL